MVRPDLDVKYEDWHAVHDHLGKTLRIFGRCIVDGGGFAIGIESREGQGVNPGILMLNIRATPTGESPSHQALEYQESWMDDFKYDEVGFSVIGDVSVPIPPTLPVEDLY